MLLMIVIPRFQLALVLGDSQGDEPMVSEGPPLAGPWVMRLSYVVSHLCVPDFELSSWPLSISHVSESHNLLFFLWPHPTLMVTLLGDPGYMVIGSVL